MSPRVAHNEKLTNEFLKKNGIAGTHKAVGDQIASTQINRLALSKFGYNPSLILHEGNWLMAYRWHPKNTPQTALALATLDANLNVTSNQQIEVPNNLGSVEDPRLFTFKGDLFMSYVDSTWPNKPPKCMVKYGKLLRAPWRVQDAVAIPYGANDGTSMEKNWVFFAYNDKLHAIYQCHPDHVVFETSEPKNLWKTKAAHWPWGAIRGGTSPVPYKGNWLRFFHSGLDYDQAPYWRRYYVGALVMQSEPPFGVIKVSSKPVVVGSESCELNQAESAACVHYKQKVVFPGGCVESSGGWLVSCGVNDSQCVVLNVTEKELNL
jgi:predicted GH43/DUF377 family glycosyl hydrolase